MSCEARELPPSLALFDGLAAQTEARACKIKLRTDTRILSFQASELRPPGAPHRLGLSLSGLVRSCEQRLSRMREAGLNRHWAMLEDGQTKGTLVCMSPSSSSSLAKLTVANCISSSLPISTGIINCFKQYKRQAVYILVNSLVRTNTMKTCHRGPCVYLLLPQNWQSSLTVK